MLKNCFILNSFFVSHTKKETKKSLRWGNDLIKLRNHPLGFTNSLTSFAQTV